MSVTLSSLLARTPRDDSLKALAAMFDSLTQIVDYASAGEDHFRSDRRTQDAVMYRIICAGEAAKRFTDAYEGEKRPDNVARLDHANDDLRKVKLTESQWKGLTSMRDALAHRIDEQDVSIAWDAAQNHVPLMIPPVWEALSTAPMAWFTEGGSPGRRATQKRVFEDFHALFTGLQINLNELARRSTVQVFESASDTSRRLLAAATGVSLDSLPDADFNSADVASNFVTDELRRQELSERIEEALFESYDEDALWSLATEYGRAPAIEEAFAESVELDEANHSWTAILVATVSFSDDEGDSLGEKRFTGTASGTVDEGNVETDVIEWSGPDRGDLEVDQDNEF